MSSGEVVVADPDGIVEEVRQVAGSEALTLLADQPTVGARAGRRLAATARSGTSLGSFHFRLSSAPIAQRSRVERLE